MKAYKGFKRHEDGTLWCLDFQYKVGKTYTFDGEPILCLRGFHACHELHQCWAFYPNNGKKVYYEVECGGTIIESVKGDGKFVCTEITLVKEIPAPENKFDWCGYFSDGYATVLQGEKCNYISTEGKYLSEQWWDYCDSFQDGYASVWSKGNWYKIDTNGKIIEQ